MLQRSLGALLLVLLLANIGATARAAPAFVWREADTADTASFAAQTQKGPAEVLSGGQWLNVSLSKEQIATGKLPAGGWALTYRLNVAQTGTYRLWIRQGLEFVRPPLAWRMDGGAWKTIEPKDLTTNMTEIWTWCEVGWSDAGTLELPAGAHTLELEVEKPGTNGGVNLALDALCLAPPDWVPDGPLKPGEEPSAEADRKAAAQVYAFGNTPEAPARAELSLNGLWQVARYDDPDMDRDTYEPVRELPAGLHWRGIEVPSDLWKVPALNMAHRVWYRCRVDVPARLAGRSFLLDFTGTNWIASVRVNGQFVGWRKSTRVPWQCDISRALKPGQVNEICIGIKSAWYAVDAAAHKCTVDERRNLPREEGFLKWQHWVAPIWPSSKGDADGSESGITDPVSLVVAGPAYVADTYVQTSVAKKSISAAVTLRNPTAAEVEATVQAEALFEGSGKVEKSLPQATVRVPAGGTAEASLTAPWADAKLWWPGEDPAAIYRLRTTVSVAGKAVDVSEQRFGFREVTLDGKYIRINGLRRNFWNLLDGLKGGSPEEMLAHFKKGNNRFERFSSDLRLRNAIGPRRAQLDWTDAHGIPGRLSTMIDGMFINYSLDHPIVWENFREHIEQVVRAYRNHPSIVVYSLENELMLINGTLLMSNLMDQIEAEAKRSLYDTARRLDPTRPCMMDGAGALTTNQLDINCMHYPEVSEQQYPENAYALKDFSGFSTFKGRWDWDHQRPLAMGETAGSGGTNSGKAWVGGDRVFLSREEAWLAYGKYLRSLIEGYRWNDVAMICPWSGQDETPNAWVSMAPVAAFVREQNASFFGSEPVRRTVKVFNDTFSTAPVRFSWSVVVNGKQVAGGSQSLTIEPGFGKELTLAFAGPKVAQRTSARLVLSATQPGAPAFRDVKEIAFFPRIKSLSVKRPVYVLEAAPKLAKRLAAWGVPVKPVREMAQVTTPRGILLVGPDAIQAGERTAPLMAYARAGGRVIFLEQDAPAEGLAPKPADPRKPDGPSLGPDGDLPAPVRVGRGKANPRDKEFHYTQAQYAFAQGLGTPLLAGLEGTDFSNWAGDVPTAKRVWYKPTGSARSWVECGSELNYSALIEVPCGQGEILAIQMRVGAKLGVEPAAQVLLTNLLRRADSYAPPARAVALYAPGRPEILKLMKDIGCRFHEAGSLAQALDAKTTPIAVVHASRANLETLLRERARVDAYTAAGGWVMLWGLEPDGLNAYNALLGTQHLLRGFRMERVSAVPDVLMAGLGNRDVAQYGSGSPAPWSGDKWLSPDVFTYCVDGADIAPFCRLPEQKDEPYKPTFDDKDPYNWVNGMTGHENWRYIRQIWAGDWPAAGSPPFLFKLPVPCRITRVKVWNNAFYYTIKDLEIQVDGQKAATLVLPDAMAPAALDLGGKPARQSLGLVVRNYRTKPNMGPLVGIDNVEFLRELPAWYQGRVFPLVNVGGLVRYPRGRGGFLLNELKLTDNDTKENAAKKERLVAVLLQNLGAAFGGGRARSGGASAQAGDWQSLMTRAKDAIMRYAPADAETALLAAVKLAEGEATPEHLQESLDTLAGLYRSLDRLADAEPLLVRALALTEKARGAQHADTAQAHYALGDLYALQGKWTEAERHLQVAQAVLEKVKGKAHADLMPVLKRRAQALRKLGREAEAKELDARIK